jgi:hypothetical protein
MSEFQFDTSVDYDNEFAGDDKLFLKFETRQVKDPVKSLEAGRPIYKDEDWVNIMVPGDRSNMIETALDEHHLRRFGRQYAKWKNARAKGQEGEQGGTPLSSWPLVERSTVEELAFFHVHTVEQLVSMNDVHASKFPGIRELQRKANLFLAAAKGDAPILKLQDENEKLKAEVASNKIALSSLEDKIAALTELVKIKAIKVKE